MTDKTTVKYSFDDSAVGILRPNGKSLGERLINRPFGLSNIHWYAHAAEIVSALKTIAAERPAGLAGGAGASRTRGYGESEC